MNTRHIKNLIFLLTLSAAFFGCAKDDDVDDLTSKYKYPIPAVTLTKNANVGAYYFNYTSSDWNKAHSDTSLLGKPYNAITNPAVLPQQLSWADEGGIDYLIFKWNGSSDNALLNAFVTARTTQKVKMVISYNTAHLSATNASPLTGTKLQTMITEFKTLVENHISKDYYFKLGERPIILLTPLNLTSSASNSIDHAAVVGTLREELNSVGINPFFIGELTTGWTAPVNFKQETLSAMDGIVLTTWNTADFDRWWAFYSYSDLSYQNWKTSLDTMGVEYVPSIFPGFDEAGSSTQRKIERTESNYVDYTNVAKRSMGKNQLVIINSWNDWIKGTSLEPSVKYNKTFLEITKREFKVQ